MSKIKLQAAKELIQEQKYEEARTLLKTIEHPTAKAWLVKLDKLINEQDVIPSIKGKIASFNLICPKCEKQNIYSIATPQEWYNFVCPVCKNAFSSRIVRIRAKRSRKDKYSRSYSIRVYDLLDREQLIEFSTDPNKPDIELRARDLAAFSYQKNKLLIVQNFTVGLYANVGQRPTSCLLIIGLAVLVFILFTVSVLMNGS